MVKSHKKFLNVSPLSTQAKHRFATFMNSFHACVVESEKNNMYLLTSLNGEYCFWVQREGNEHWKVEK